MFRRVVGRTSAGSKPGVVYAGGLAIFCNGSQGKQRAGSSPTPAPAAINFHRNLGHAARRQPPSAGGVFWQRPDAPTGTSGARKRASLEKPPPTVFGNPLSRWERARVRAIRNPPASTRHAGDQHSGRSAGWTNEHIRRWRMSAGGSLGTPLPTLRTPTAFHTIARGWTRSVLPRVPAPRPPSGRATRPPSIGGSPRPNQSEYCFELLRNSKPSNGLLV
jgi:hypothetical protein